MASHQQQSPTAGIPQHHGLPPGHPQANGVAHLPPQGKGASQYLTSVNENVWLSLGISPLQGPIATRGRKTNPLQAPCRSNWVTAKARCLATNVACITIFIPSKQCKPLRHC